MPFTIPNDVSGGSTKQHAQAAPDKVDIDILVAGYSGSGVISGCTVSAQGTPDMTVAVAAGSVQVASVAASVSAGNVTIGTADGTNPRFDLIVSNGSGTLSATAGTAAASPVFPSIPSSSVVLAAVYVGAGVTTITSADIVDKRVVIGWFGSDGSKTATPQVARLGVGTTPPSTAGGVANLGGSVAAGTTAHSAVSINPALSFTGSTGLGTNYIVNISGTWTGSTDSSYILKGINFSPTFVNAGTSDGWSVLGGIYYAPTFSHTGSAQTGTGADHYSFYIKPTIGSGQTFLTHYGVYVSPSVTGTVTTDYGIYLSGSKTGTVTTSYAVYIAATNGTTAWGIFDNVGANHTLGKVALTIGAPTPTAPSYALHIIGGNNAAAALGINTTTTGPADPGSNAGAAITIYKGSSNYHFLIRFNDGGTTRYKSLQLNSTGVTWVHGTSLPT